VEKRTSDSHIERRVGNWTPVVGEVPSLSAKPFKKRSRQLFGLNRGHYLDAVRLVAMQHLRDKRMSGALIDFSIAGVVIAQLERFRYRRGSWRRTR